MKKVGMAVLALLLLTGCAGENRALERGIALRSSLLKASACSFDAEVTADYGEYLYSFAMSCRGDSDGELDFTVTAPDTIAGITGRIDKTGGTLTFDDTALAFDLLPDGQTSPISAPWLLLQALLGGYLTSAGEEGEGLRLTIDDSYADNALTLDIWLDSSDLPTRAEIQYDGRRILGLSVKNFTIL